MDINFIGEIRRILFHAQDTGFTVANMLVTDVKQGSADNRNLIIVTGNLPKLSEGEALEIFGTWKTHPKYGPQVVIETYNYLTPVSEHGLLNYLSSGLIDGIGKTLARKIVDKFGENTIDTLDNNIDLLNEIENIGTKTVNTIKHSWKEHKKNREIMIKLQSYDITPAMAMKIYDLHGKDALEVVKQNPYRLSYEIEGVGFIRADSIAMKLGFPMESVERAEAALIYVLEEKMHSEGHICYPFTSLINDTQELLKSVDTSLANKAYVSLLDKKEIVTENFNNGIQEDTFIYLTKHYKREKYVAKKLVSFANSDKLICKDIDELRERIRDIAKDFKIELTPKQEAAVGSSLFNHISIITGGPGTGKTTIIRIILKYLQLYRKDVLEIALAAPTGRAAKRMNELTDHSAKTIHRLLEYNPGFNHFKRDEADPLTCNVLIIDETSMIDLSLMYYLLKAVHINTVLIFVGDMYQLPSVGPGNVLRDMIFSNKLPIITLDVVFRHRDAKDNLINVNAHKINSGQMPILIELKDERDVSFYFVEESEPTNIRSMIKNLICKYIPQRFNYDPILDIQLLSPMNKDKILGTITLNKDLQDILNDGEGRGELKKGTTSFRAKDKVMQIKNNYEKEVFNGDVGYIEFIDEHDKKLQVNFDGRSVPYHSYELDELTLAYAVSIHKSQGSEYPVVVVPVVKRHYILLQRNLIYTAITRGKQLVILIGTKDALMIAINNNKIQRRFTFLKNRIILNSV